VGIGLLSLLLLFRFPSGQSMSIIWFALLTLMVGGSLWFVRGNAQAKASALHSSGKSSPVNAD